MPSSTTPARIAAHGRESSSSGPPTTASPSCSSKRRVGGKAARIYTVYIGKTLPDANGTQHGLAIQFVRPVDDIDHHITVLAQRPGGVHPSRTRTDNRHP